MRPRRRRTTYERRPRVLVVDGTVGQGRATLATGRALAVGGYAPGVTVTGERSIAASSRAARTAHRVPAASSPEFATTVESLVRRHGFVASLATTDAALVATAAPGAWLVDKRALAERAAAFGTPTPPVRVVAGTRALREIAHDLEYPAVAKPALKDGAAWPARRLDAASDVATPPSYEGPLVVQPFIDEPMRAFAGVVIDGTLLAAVHQRYLRTWPTPCGTAAAAVTTDPDHELEERVLTLLEGHDGVFQVQLAGPWLLDVNPRPYGSLPLAVRAGANLAAIAVDARRGYRDATIVRARVGVPYRWIEGDLRHVGSRLRDGSMSWSAAIRALRPRRGTAHSDWSWRDPLPTLGRLRVAASRARS